MDQVVGWMELPGDLFFPVIQSQAIWEHDSLATRIFRDRSSSSFYLPNNTTVCSFTSIQSKKSRTAMSDKNTNSCLKTCNKTVTWYIFYHTECLCVHRLTLARQLCGQTVTAVFIFRSITYACHSSLCHCSIT